MAHHKNVHLRPEEAVERLLRPVHDRLVLVERGVEQDRHASLLLERPNELPVERIGLAADGLEPAAAVHMRHGRDDPTLVRPHRVDLDHERVGYGAHEIVVEGLFEDRRRERPELLPELDLRVDGFPHVGPARVGQDAPVAERPGAPLHPPLEPADDLALGEPLGRPAAQPLLVVDAVRRGADLA